MVNFNLRKRAMNSLIVFVFLLCSASTCKKNKHCPKGSHSRITIENKSARNISWISDDNPNDTIWTVNGDYPGISERVIPGSSSYQVAAGLEKCWEYFYMGGYSHYYFIFDHDTVQAIGWQAISGTNRGLLKKVKVDLSYLKNNNFTITFP